MHGQPSLTMKEGLPVLVGSPWHGNTTKVMAAILFDDLAVNLGCGNVQKLIFPHHEQVTLLVWFNVVFHSV